jgi:hypothetical protein
VQEVLVADDQPGGGGAGQDAVGGIQELAGQLVDGIAVVFMVRPPGRNGVVAAG